MNTAEHGSNKGLAQTIEAKPGYGKIFARRKELSR
jgi:hypothetical protein